MKLKSNPFDWLLIGFILSLLLLGCKSKETIVERTKTSDTLINKSFDYVSQPIKTTITIDDICDSLGNVRKFNQIETSGENKANIYTKDNKLNIDLLTGLSRFKTDTIYKTKYKDVYKDRRVTRYKTNPWHWVVHLASIIIVFIIVKFSSLSPINWIKKNIFGR